MRPFTAAWLFTIVAFIAAGVPALASVTQVSEGSGVVVKRANTNEQYERDVDEVALAAQEQAISKLSGLLKKYSGTHQEPILLAKLAELQQQSAAIRFRIAHGLSRGGHRAPDLNAFKKTIRQSIATLTELIRKYPSYAEIGQAYYLRGHGYEEIDDKGSATRDYLHLVGHFPDAEETISAYMSLAEFAVEANEHFKAIEYLRQVEKHPDDPHYPFALYKLAWSHYNLKNIPTSLSYVERHVAYLTDRRAQAQKAGLSANISTSDDALRENMLLDATVFYLEGYEQKIPQYGVPEALAYFKKLENGPILGKMLLRYAKLLRSHDHEQALVTWKDQVLLGEADRPESLEVLITVYEHQLNQRTYPQMVESAQDMTRLYKRHKEFESFPRAQKLLLDTAEGLQTLVVKNRGAEGVQAFSASLASIYDAFTRIVEETDARIPRVHYNLAETLFEIHDFDLATTHYRWVVEHAELAKGPGAPKAEDAGLKAISSRYESLRQHQLIPGELKAQAIPAQPPKKPDILLAEWVEWVDAHVRRYQWKAGDPAENFLFEANRALYGAAQVQAASERMIKFATKHPDSRFATASASLALDTHIATQDWEGTHELATDLLEIGDWKDQDYPKRLLATAADAFYKLVELKHREKDYKATVKKANEFLKRYASSQRLADCLSLAGNSALSLGDKKAALGYFSRLIAEAPKAETIPAALLARAAIEEERYLFAPAARDYKAYLGARNNPAIRLKTLTLAWLSGDSNELKALLASTVLCPGEDEDCSAFQALALLDSQRNTLADGIAEDAFNRSKKASSNRNKTLWAAVALQNPKDLEFRERLSLIRTVATNWEDLEPLSRFTLVPFISASIPHALQLNRMAMREVAPLRPDARHITRRVEAIHEMENAATKVVKLPWARLRAATLNEMAALYLDLSHGLQSLPAPKGLPEAEVAAYTETIQKLVMPFEEKGQDMRGKAFEIASRFAIEDEAFQAIADPFFQDNPSQAKALRPQHQIQKPTILNISLLASIDPAGHWLQVAQTSDPDRETDDPAWRLKTRWAAAVAARQWAQLAFFLQEAKEKHLIIGGAQGALKAVSLAAAGARGEALIELEEARNDLGPEAKLAVSKVLLQHYEQSLHRERIEAISKQIPKVPGNS